MHKKITVLLFIDWFLPGTASGGPVRSLTNMMNHMEAYLDFKVITRNTDYVSSKPYSEVSSNEWNRIFSNVEVFYLSKEEITLAKFKKLIKGTNFDVVYVNGIYSPLFSILPLIALRHSQQKIIVGARGMLNPQAFSVKGFKKRSFISIMKLFKFYKNVVFHATNEDEKKHIKHRIAIDNQIVVAPNFPRKLGKIENDVKAKIPGHANFVNVARISIEKGTLYMLKLLTEINNGKITLDIYGPVYDKEYWKQCKDIMSKLPDNINVNYKGAIDGHEIPNVLSNSHFFIMPSEGENFGHSIIEAMSAGLPVLISDNTPWKNLEAKRVGWDIKLGDTAKYIDSINKCLNMNQDEYSEFSNSSFHYAQEIINDNSVLKANKRLFFG